MVKFGDVDVPWVHIDESALATFNNIVKCRILVNGTSVIFDSRTLAGYITFIKKSVIVSLAKITFSDFDRGHKKATLSISKDMIVLIKRALKGKLEEVGKPEIVKRVITNIAKAEEMIREQKS